MELNLISINKRVTSVNKFIDLLAIYETQPIYFLWEQSSSHPEWKNPSHNWNIKIKKNSLEKAWDYPTVKHIFSDTLLKAAKNIDFNNTEIDINYLKRMSFYSIPDLLDRFLTDFFEANPYRSITLIESILNQYGRSLKEE